MTTLSPTRATVLRDVGRWLVSFAGFPLGGVAAIALTGPVDSPLRAVTGGLVTGAVLGAAQGWALRGDRRWILTWAGVTALGLAVGLGVGASLVGFRTGIGDLAVQGLVCGAAVGAAQAVPLVRRLGPGALGWPVWLSATWALGWVVTTAIGVAVDDRFTVFGSAGAVVVAALTAVLPLALRRSAS